ncbi:hypothetical protein CORC01_09093 [Colletotrichum orchidophilum]|uniref:PHD-type domain-containing protein n=1 Tax=Colletotrichum orchidophilum TaxID=1209926 RepID=A0A1G4B2P4_9PEZI|nr:uncharacterized protein CORC01_09093 [Colletotrichum orchidophilum]OHE95661.1 hypothetical protein CORC01_09093 [Colletotrichum orchidophilum]
MDDEGSREPPRKRLRSAKPSRRGRPRGRGGSLNTDAARPREDEPETQTEQAQAPVIHVRSSDPRSLSIPSALERYKAWKEAGAHHVEICFICQQPEDLTYCVTCRRSYHESCKPKESASSVIEGTTHFFCEVCVGRNWHKEPPFLMPAMWPSAASAAPSSSSARAETVDGTEDSPSTRGVARQDVPSPRDVHQDQEASGTEASRTTPSTVTRRSRNTNISQPAAREPTAGPASNNTRTENTPLPPPPPATSRETPRDESNRGSSTGRPPAARRSRYATLPTDVDVALRLLYAELEAAHELRHKVGDLEGQVSQMQRELNLRNSELALARRAADMSRISQGEMEQLRAQASQGQQAIAEAAGMRAENGLLRAELEKRKVQLAETNQTLQEWKQKLSALIS